MSLDILRPYSLAENFAMRIVAHFAQGDELAKFDQTDRHYGKHIMDVDVGHPANCITSGPRVGDLEALHLPMLDDDGGRFRVAPSRTAGHQHVYIDKAITWKNYVRLLELLAELGLVDETWARLSISQGAATLRYPAR